MRKRQFSGAAQLVPAGSPLALARAATALAVVSVGALAIGALAIGRLAIKRVVIDGATLKRLRIGELEVDRVRVNEPIVVARQVEFCFAPVTQNRLCRRPHPYTEFVHKSRKRKLLAASGRNDVHR